MLLYIILLLGQIRKFICLKILHSCAQKMSNVTVSSIHLNIHLGRRVWYEISNCVFNLSETSHIL